MTNKNNSPSIELCKKLTAAGFPYTQKKIFDDISVPSSGYRMPSESEMLDVLPLGTTKELFLRDFQSFTYGDGFPDIKEIPRADALAETILWLLENGYRWEMSPGGAVLWKGFTL